MLSTNDLTNIFTLQTGKPDLRTRESSAVEFKQSFNFAGLAEYIKDFAAFANNSGGYIVFGVQNRPHIPTGLQNDQFENIDEERITEDVNQLFSPAIEWMKDIYVWNEKSFGIIYVHESRNKPVIAVKDGGREQEIKNGEIYYRYAARTEKIHYAELKQIIDEKIQNERREWQSLLERIAKIGPEIGDVQPVSVVGIKEKIVHDDPYKLRATHVAEQVAKAIDKRFRVNPEHVKSWKYYSVRGTYDEGKAKCNPKYCDYKESFGNYAYTQDWVDFLIKELSDPKKYNEAMSAHNIE